VTAAVLVDYSLRTAAFAESAKLTGLLLLASPTFCSKQA